MKSALLFYHKLVTDLCSIGFVLNPYDPCAANKMIDNHQMTICWHVNDLLLGHNDSTTVTNFIQWLQDCYETPDKPLQATRGTLHDYLGMTIDFSTPGDATFDMIPYLRKVLNDFPEKITGVSSTPAANHLSKIWESLELPETQAIAFHHTTAQLLFLSRTQHDIQTAIAFLTTRVKAPDEDNWGKLKRVIKYLNGTKNLKLHLLAESLSIIQWYVDASHQTHKDCKGHTGAFLTLGAGATTSSSNKQKINTKSSTETELIRLYDKSGDILWTRNFLEAQGYTISANIVFQDNMSSLSLEKNGRLSSSKQTKHIKAKYFFTKHYYDAGNLDLCYCPSEHMWADILTKPLQGTKFWEIRAILMNCPVDYSKDPPFISPNIVPSPIQQHPMKPQINMIAPSSWECVEVSPSVPTVHKPVLKGPNSYRKKVMWKSENSP